MNEPFQSSQGPTIHDSALTFEEEAGESWPHGHHHHMHTHVQAHMACPGPADHTNGISGSPHYSSISQATCGKPEWGLAQGMGALHKRGGWPRATCHLPLSDYRVPWEVLPTSPHVRNIIFRLLILAEYCKLADNWWQPWVILLGPITGSLLWIIWQHSRGYAQDPWAECWPWDGLDESPLPQSIAEQETHQEQGCEYLQQRQQRCQRVGEGQNDCPPTQWNMK